MKPNWKLFHVEYEQEGFIVLDTTKHSAIKQVDGLVVQKLNDFLEHQEEENEETNEAKHQLSNEVSRYLNYYVREMELNTESPNIVSKYYVR
jgi:ethanolamine ammonia-lyase large subunit